MTQNMENHLPAPSTLGKRRRHDESVEIKLIQVSSPQYGFSMASTPGAYTPISSSPRQKSVAFEVRPLPSTTNHFHTGSQHLSPHIISYPDQISNTMRTITTQPIPKSPRRSPAKIRRRILRESSANAHTNPKSKALESDIKVQQICLDRCHICHKAPKLKTDLDSYGDCWRCHKRVCYICVRMCEAQSCGGRKICSSCCVEQGEEGNVSCLDCIQSEDHIMQDSWSR
jgi:hypothetical protein